MGMDKEIDRTIETIVTSLASLRTLHQHDQQGSEVMLTELDEASRSFAWYVQAWKIQKESNEKRCNYAHQCTGWQQRQ